MVLRLLAWLPWVGESFTWFSPVLQHLSYLNWEFRAVIHPCSLISQSERYKQYSARILSTIFWYKWYFALQISDLLYRWHLELILRKKHFYGSVICLKKVLHCTQNIVSLQDSWYCWLYLSNIPCCNAVHVQLLDHNECFCDNRVHGLVSNCNARCILILQEKENHGIQWNPSLKTALKIKQK